MSRRREGVTKDRNTGNWKGPQQKKGNELLGKMLWKPVDSSRGRQTKKKSKFTHEKLAIKW